MERLKQPFLIASVVISAVGIVLSSIALYRIVEAGRDVALARKDLKIVLAKLRAEDDGLTDEPGPEPEVRFATLGDAEAFVKKLGESPTAGQLAEAILALDGWLVRPDDEKAFKKFKLDQQPRLRKLVKAEVTAHHEACLGAANGTEGAKEHAEAGRIMAMYPMSDDPTDLEEARLLQAGHAEVAGRLESLRRQRYNRWAAGRIDEAVSSYKKNKYSINPLQDNFHLVGLLVENLGDIDPALLEPAVLELYNYVIDLTKGSISEGNKLELAKRLTDPSIRRKALGDF